MKEKVGLGNVRRKAKRGLTENLWDTKRNSHVCANLGGVMQQFTAEASENSHVLNIRISENTSDRPHITQSRR